MYATRSNCESENGAVVRRALEQHGAADQMTTTRFRLKKSMEFKEEEPSYYVAVLDKKVYMQHMDFFIPRSSRHNGKVGGGVGNLGSI